jgi:hypothetical protein
MSIASSVASSSVNTLIDRVNRQQLSDDEIDAAPSPVSSVCSRSPTLRLPGLCLAAQPKPQTLKSILQGCFEALSTLLEAPPPDVLPPTSVPARPVPLTTTPHGLIQAQVATAAASTRLGQIIRKLHITAELVLKAEEEWISALDYERRYQKGEKFRLQTRLEDNQAKYTEQEERLETRKRKRDEETTKKHDRARKQRSITAPAANVQ